MGKHNGKARKAGLVVGSALVNRAKKDGRTGSAAAYLHATDTVVETNMQSVIEANDLDEMMAMVSMGASGLISFAVWSLPGMLFCCVHRHHWLVKTSLLSESTSL
jgi:hypothetical protein